MILAMFANFTILAVLAGSSCSVGIGDLTGSVVSEQGQAQQTHIPTTMPEEETS